QLAHAWPRKNGFRHDRKSEDLAVFQATDRDDGNHDVLEQMDAQYPPFTQPLGTRKLDVVLRQTFPRGGARNADNERALGGRNGECGKDQIAQPFPVEEAQLYWPKIFDRA